MCGFFTMTWNRHGGNPLLGNPCQFRHPTTPTPGTGHAFAAALAKVPSSSGAAEVPWEWWHIWSLKGMMKAGQKPATDVAHLLYTHQLQLTTTKKAVYSHSKEIQRRSTQWSRRLRLLCEVFIHFLVFSTFWILTLCSRIFTLLFGPTEIGFWTPLEWREEDMIGWDLFIF